MKITGIAVRTSIVKWSSLGVAQRTTIAIHMQYAGSLLMVSRFQPIQAMA